MGKARGYFLELATWREPLLRQALWIAAALGDSRQCQTGTVSYPPLVLPFELVCLFVRSVDISRCGNHER